jgi:hypothetical protein
MNSANLTRSQQIWRLVDEGYRPIDWQLDFKSGYRWSEATWAADIRFGHLPGVDVKVPWELARMQHLPQLAVCYAVHRNQPQRAEFCERLGREFRNEVLDFAATNPPRFGVNWHCTMDVAIRAANWLVAYDVFVAAGARFDDAFRTVFVQAIGAHGEHIINHLEWWPHHRANHYLANVAGLAFVAAYLPRTRVTDAWLAFSVQELIREVKQQFHREGTNFEGSTCYHGLAAEMVTYATALVLGLPGDRLEALRAYDHTVIRRRPHLRPAPLPLYADERVGRESPFPPWYWRRLERMGEFLIHATKPSGRLHQVGDNDSGRFLKLAPRYEKLTVREAIARFANLADVPPTDETEEYWCEPHLDARPLVAAISGLIPRDDFVTFASPCDFERQMVTSLARVPDTRVAPARGSQRVRKPAEASFSQVRESLNQNAALCQYSFRMALPSDALSEGLQVHAYPQFGLYIWRNSRFYVAVRCGRLCPRNTGGHAHLDQLSVELNIDGEDILADPGTYLYTPAPQQRNAHRSVAAHSAPQTADQREPGVLDTRLFALADAARASCLYWGDDGFVGQHEGFAEPVYRALCWMGEWLEIADYGSPTLRLLSPAVMAESLITNRSNRIRFSPAYGVHYRT